MTQKLYAVPGFTRLSNLVYRFLNCGLTQSTICAASVNGTRRLTAFLPLLQNLISLPRERNGLRFQYYFVVFVKCTSKVCTKPWETRPRLFQSAVSIITQYPVIYDHLVSQLIFLDAPGIPFGISDLCFANAPFLVRAVLSTLLFQLLPIL